MDQTKGGHLYIDAGEGYESINQTSLERAYHRLVFI